MELQSWLGKEWPCCLAESCEFPFDFSALHVSQYLALACTDAKDDANLKFVKEIETVITQPWKFFRQSDLLVT